MTESTNWNPALYDRSHAFVARYGESLIDLLDPQPGEEILDLGCGTGELTLPLQQTGAHVTGLDLSPSMLATARQRFMETDVSIPLIEGDVRSLDFDRAFDAVFSNAVLHWVPEAQIAAQSIYRALRPGGRFVVELGGQDNNHRMVQALLQAMSDILDGPPPTLPWYFPSPDEYRKVLEAEGFRVDSLQWFRRPTLLEEGAVIDWYRMFVGNWWRAPAVDRETQERVFRRATELVSPGIESQGRHYADYVRLRVRAIREETAERP